MILDLLSLFCLWIFYLIIVMILPNIVFSLGTPVSSTNKTDRLNIAEILLKVTLKTINQTLILHNIVFSRVRAQVTEGYASYVGL